MPTEANDRSVTAPVKVAETFHVHDERSANWVLKKIVAEREYRGRCAGWFEAETRRSERRERFLMLRFGGELAEWARGQLTQQFGKRRSIHLPAGIIGFRN